ncbi:unnamed protein product [Moneuplotes crassus]|uniref:Uncharacterized protein n=1 Tax=Euplotes crassus TaxID=5936 RepID=A0AAD1XAX3_EUPCR|nr:unnamed protein product [Moneuplotes crassus]
MILALVSSESRRVLRKLRSQIRKNKVCSESPTRQKMSMVYYEDGYKMRKNPPSQKKNEQFVKFKTRATRNKTMKKLDFIQKRKSGCLTMNIDKLNSNSNTKLRKRSKKPYETGRKVVQVSLSPSIVHERKKKVNKQIEKLKKLVYIHPALDSIRNTRKQEDIEYGTFRTDMSPLRLLKNIGNMYLHNSNYMREEMDHINEDSGSEVGEEVLDVKRYDDYFPPVESIEKSSIPESIQPKKSSMYVNYVDKNGGFMNIHEKIDGEIVIPELPEILNLPNIDPYLQKEMLGKIIHRISATEKEMEREYQALIKPPPRIASPLSESNEEEVIKFKKPMFPSISLNGQKSKWRLDQEKKEAKIQKNLRDRARYDTNKPKYPSKKVEKKHNVMLAMEGPYYFGDVEVKRLKKKLYEYRYPKRSRTKIPSPPSNLELTDKLKVRKFKIDGVDRDKKQEAKVWKQYKEAFNEEKNKIMADMYLSRMAAKAKKEEEVDQLSDPIL